jgi:uncharacterized protein YoxC
MSDIFLGIITLAVVVATVYIIRVLTELKADLAAVKECTQRAEESLIPLLQELQMTARSVRTVTDDVGGITGDVRVFTGSVREIGENVKQVSRIVEDFGRTSALSVTGLRAGVTTALGVLIGHIINTKKKH